MSQITELIGSTGANEHRVVTEGHKRGKTISMLYWELLGVLVYKSGWVSVDTP